MQELTFIQNGTIKIGFEFMQQQKFAIKKVNSAIVGAYPVTFNQRSRFIYRVFSKQAFGYFIRRLAWIEILQSRPDVTSILISKIIFEYMMNFRPKMIRARNEVVQQMMRRNDHDMIMMTKELDGYQSEYGCKSKARSASQLQKDQVEVRQKQIDFLTNMGSIKDAWEKFIPWVDQAIKTK